MSDKEMMEQFQMIATDLHKAIVQSEGRTRAEISRVETDLREAIHEEIHKSETRIMVYVENNITKRLNSLYDGYKQNYGQEEAISIRQDKIERNMDNLQARVAVLEGKTA
jgi:hypothetical protein